MKKLLCMVLVLAMTVACFAGCAGKASSDETIKVGMVGCYTGDYAVYGDAVKKGAELYFNQYNEKGGVNGQKIEIVAYDNKGDSAETVNAFTRLVDEGVTAVLGAVLTGNTLAVVGEAYPINMPVVTASATADAVTYDAENDTVYTNVYRTCFIDPFQGEKMAAYAYEKMGAKTASLLVETGNDYAVGVAAAFTAKFTELGGTILSQEGYATGAVDFKPQLTNMNAQNPDMVFCPNYYEDDGMIITQAREIGMTCPFAGSDGFGGIAGYASAEDLEGTVYCSGYAPGSTDAVKKFEEEFKAAYGEDVPNMFAPLAYDAAMLICAALEKVEAECDAAPASDEYKQAIIDAIKVVGPEIAGITSGSGYAFDEYNNPVKEAVIMELVGGAETFKEMY